MKTCPRCGTVNPDTNRFCTGCGQALDAAIQQPQQTAPQSPYAQQPYNQPDSYQQSYSQPNAYEQPYGQIDPYQQPYGGPNNGYDPNYFAPQPTSPKKSPLIPILIGCVSVLLVGVVVTLIVVMTRKPKNDTSNYVYDDGWEISEEASLPESASEVTKPEASQEASSEETVKESEEAASQPSEESAESTAGGSAEESAEASETQQAEESEAQAEVEKAAIAALPRPSLMAGAAPLNNQSLVPSVPSYTVEPDFSNVTNSEILYMPDDLKAQIARDGFAVVRGGNKEFFEIYENNRYMYMANFVTVDSMMHTYHLYFAHLMKNTEKSYLADTLANLSLLMLDKASAQLETLRGTEWESAALKNVAFFAIGASLQNDSVSIPAEVQSIVEQETALILEHSQLINSPLTGIPEDYSQYKPRGYYEGDPQLEAYFRAMMWYGRLNFKQKEEELDRCALLMTLCLDQDTLPAWESIYTITSFFAGTSDDSGYYEYKPLIDAAYGEGATAASLPGNAAAWDTFHQLTAQLDPPRINSVPMDDDGGATDKVAENKGYRFMGQRFTLDEAIFQNLTYSKVQEKSETDRRMLPDVLDAAAAMGSDQALTILEMQGDTGYPGYLENMQKLRDEVKSAGDEQWNASLYSSWLYTLQPLLDAKGEGYPGFMQTGLWAQKNLESFAGSFTELKHDTVLYAKQMMAEMGGGDIPVVDDRGYVEPEPEIFSRLAVLTEKTSSGLKGYGMLSETDEENLALLSSLARQLMVISEKELVNETLTDEEYELIRTFGGNLEHFWLETIKDEAAAYDDVYLSRSDQFPAALVVDIATDPNGSCLEVATGNPSTIYVACVVDGQLKICSGSVYNFYQFSWPSSDRMTDSQWRQLMGIQMQDDGSYNWDRVGAPDKPAWTLSYRYDYGNGF